MSPAQQKLSRREIYDRFCSRECAACGGRKAPNTGFCRSCYRTLPQAMKNALWKRFGEGFEAAYEQGLAWLQGRSTQ